MTPADHEQSKIVLQTSAEAGEATGHVNLDLGPAGRLAEQEPEPVGDDSEPSGPSRWPLPGIISLLSI